MEMKWKLETENTIENATSQLLQSCWSNWTCYNLIGIQPYFTRWIFPIGFSSWSRDQCSLELNFGLFCNILTVTERFFVKYVLKSQALQAASLLKWQSTCFCLSYNEKRSVVEFSRNNSSLTENTEKCLIHRLQYVQMQHHTG